MGNRYTDTDLKLTEQTISEDTFDFTAKLFAVNEITTATQNQPATIRNKTIFALEKLLKDKKLESEHQGYFLFKEAAFALTSIAIHSKNEEVRNIALDVSVRLLEETSGNAHRAVSGSLGALPLRIGGSDDTKTINEGNTTEINLSQLFHLCGVKPISSPRNIGRSIVTQVNQVNKIVVVKLARNDDTFESIGREILWMEHLRSIKVKFTYRFDIPEPIRIKGAPVFRLKESSFKGKNGFDPHPDFLAVAYMAHTDYFSYPNDKSEEKRPDETGIKELIDRNAWLLGRLTFNGIIHDALIPLFHNRTQRFRRKDQGRYEWIRGGRLDKWVESCLYPNLGLTGIRDFEHFMAIAPENGDLFRYIGNHLFSLLLITGSYFRNKNYQVMGYDESGLPVDARDLFNKNLLNELIHGIFIEYYNGFVGTDYMGKMPIDMDRLSDRMIEEMGVDNHMEEIVRVDDQKKMTDDFFRCFLKERGYPADQLLGLKRGAQDIIVQSGPHLGAFNRKISLPELIESVATMSALCVVGRYRLENKKLS